MDCLDDLYLGVGWIGPGHVRFPSLMVYVAAQCTFLSNARRGSVYCRQHLNSKSQVGNEGHNRS